MKKLKKLVFKQETISNLNEEGMKNLKGGVSSDTSYDTVSADLPSYCQVASRNGDCGSYIASGTGFGMCCCNATGLCSS